MTENNEKDDGYSEEEEDSGWCDGAQLEQENKHSEEFDVPYSPVRSLAEDVQSPDYFTRDIATGQLLEALQTAVGMINLFSSEKDDIDTIILFIKKLSQDEEINVRCSLIRTLPKIARFCAELRSDFIQLKPIISSEFLPIVLQAIAEVDTSSVIKMRNEGHRVLEYFLKNQYVQMEDMEDHICRIYAELTEDNQNSQNLMAAVNFIARMPSLLDEGRTEKLIVPRITSLCSSEFEVVRAACVRFIVDLTFYVNSIVTENIIIPHFVKLSGDETWFVRRACAESIVILGCTCLIESRKTVLTRVFIDLLSYDDMNVQSSAFQQLGAFITTFAQPPVVSLASNRNADLLLIYNQFEFGIQSRKFQISNHGDISKQSKEYFVIFESSVKTMTVSSNSNISNNHNNNNMRINNNGRTNYDNQPDIIKSCLYRNYNQNTLKNTNITRLINDVPIKDTFNSFQFWREPIVDLEFEDSTEQDVENQGTNDGELNDDHYENNVKMHEKRWKRTKLKYDSEVSSIKIPSDKNKREWGSGVSNTTTTTTTTTQNINVEPTIVIHTVIPSSKPLHTSSASLPKNGSLPKRLLDAFVSMPDFSSLEVRRSCAFFFPAVLLTVGVQNWHIIKSAYFELAVDSEWKLRQMLANSITEVASILGPNLATTELVSIYKDFIGDFIDVRTAALKNLPKFLKLLIPSGRNSFLPLLMGFMMTDFTWNWRFREELSEQLLEMMDYYSPHECHEYFSPIVFSLLLDKVSAVRLAALPAMCNLLRVTMADTTLMRNLVSEIASQLAHNVKWTNRQTFVFLCSCLIKNSTFDVEMFACDLLPHLLDLSWDSIPNIRIAVAKTIANDIINEPYFNSNGNPHYEVLMQVITRLSHDKDRDVRYFASLATTSVGMLQVVDSEWT